MLKTKSSWWCHIKVKYEGKILFGSWEYLEGSTTQKKKKNKLRGLNRQP